MVEFSAFTPAQESSKPAKPAGRVQKGIAPIQKETNKLEDIHWEVIINELSPEVWGVINYSNQQVVKPEQLYSVEMQNLFVESIFLARGKDSIYNRALDEMQTIIGLIDEELNQK